LGSNVLNTRLPKDRRRILRFTFREVSIQRKDIVELIDGH